MPRKLIIEKLDEIGLSMSEASIKIGRNQAYLQQFLKRGIPAELPEPVRMRLADLLKVSQDELRGPSTTLPRRGYEKNATTRKSGIALESQYAYAGVPEPTILAGSEIIGSVQDLPVFGAGPGGNDSGGLALSEAPVDMAVRPPMLRHVRDAYAIIVGRAVMDPVVRPGSVVMFNPHSPPRIGDVCVWRMVKDGVTYVKGGEFRGETADAWKLRHYNPPRDFTLKKSEWTVCHRSIGLYFP